MPAFMIREKSLPGEVALELARCGTLASIRPPASCERDFVLREMKLSTALLVASSLARELGTDVVIVDGVPATEH
jgi:hypothetical protein